jgi:hypothetical protein
MALPAGGRPSTVVGWRRRRCARCSHARRIGLSSEQDARKRWGKGHRATGQGRTGFAPPTAISHHIDEELWGASPRGVVRRREGSAVHERSPLRRPPKVNLLAPSTAAFAVSCCETGGQNADASLNTSATDTARTAPARTHCGCRWSI